MSPPNRRSLRVRDLFQIILRWRRQALSLSLVLFGIVLILAVIRKPHYESQVILERKPIQITPIVPKEQNEQFDIYRLTSESQWSVALLKSRFILERWMEALGRPATTPLQKENELKRLYHSLTVQPISYTDLFMVKVRALSAEEANRRASVLVDVFSKWDLEQNRAKAQMMVDLLRRRLDQVNNELSAEWAKLKIQKANQSLSLSGSSATRQLELDINAKGKLYDMLTAELEEAERQLHIDELPRTRALAPPSLPGRPQMSRLKFIFLGLMASLLAGLVSVFLFEWQSPLTD
jgi:uncharacterized protein involved in exopolysaccharide biosynthesis